jgi:nucleotide-binding universal stress UspA family protein
MAGRPWDIEVTVGQPIPTILAEARERKADLIVAGTHLRHGWRRALLGSVSEGIIHGADCPVLTVATRDAHVVTPYAITSIICPVNFTEVARDSLRVATRIAEVFGANLTVLHVIEDGEIADAGADAEKIRNWIGPDMQTVRSVREVVVRGGAAERVLDTADEMSADLLVVGAQHKLFRQATVVGTTTERLIRFASCPVMVVPRPVARRETQREAHPEIAVAER